MHSNRSGRISLLPLFLTCLFIGLFLSPAWAAPDAAAQSIPPIQFTEETLENGLRVIYAPLHQAPVVHVRVLYHVGSRDEKPDRQGFAHMFEHMMFRGSTHVAPEQHMKMIMQVGGTSNAFTSYDQTTYWQTLPANNLEMALYLEADRMASFKVSDDIFQTERKVVAEEWRMRYANQPYGPMFQDFSRTAFTKHSYRWTPIGDMDQLRQAASSELQEFFNKYYVPNNACLIIAGDIDVDQAKAFVKKYFGWIPKGPAIERTAQAEPEQTETRRLTVKKPAVPLAQILMGFKNPAYRSDDHYALNILGDILGQGRTSRLDRALVNNASPLCNSVGGGDQQLEDPTVFAIQATALPGRDPAQIEKVILDTINDVIEKGVTQEELNKALTESRVALIRGRENAQSIATALGEEEVFGGDANRANQELEKLSKLTVADIQAVAKKYLVPEHMTVLEYLPDPTSGDRAAAATQASAAANQTASAGVAPSTEPIKPRVSEFPAGYPTTPPIAPVAANRPFEKGQEIEVDGVKVIVMSDHRLPLVNWSVVMRSGGHAEPDAKDGLASLTAAMLRRGAADMDYMALSQDLESRGITIEASDAGDTTRLGGSCTTDQVEHAIQRTRDVLLKPTFPAAEFEKLKRQTLAGLLRALANPATVAGRELDAALYGDSPLGRQTTLSSIQSITLDDVKKWYASVYAPNDALLVISGDVTPEQGKEMASKLLADWKPAASLPVADYKFPEPAKQMRIILVDNPDGKQSTIRIGIRAYDIHNPDKFPGSLAGRILSDGIHARLDRYVRAEKGYTYGSFATFQPGRHAGDFQGEVDTKPETTGPCIQAMFKVFNDMRKENVTPTEMDESKSRVAGAMVMEMQTIAQQAGRRLDGILNGYPIDYYDVYPQRLAAVTADQVREVMDKYVAEAASTIVVVAPAAQVKSQLEEMGKVEVLPMPLKRDGAMPMPMPRQGRPTTQETPKKDAA